VALTATFSRDVWWNVASLGIAGACGVAVNYAVGEVYGVDTLGVFNQVFAVYLVFSQLAALGVHTSILTHGAAADPAERGAIFRSGLAVIGVQSLVMAALFAAISPAVGALVKSPDVATGMLYAAPGVACFAFNKGTLAVLNATQHMRAYAVLQAARIVDMAIGFAACVVFDAPAIALPIILTIGEASVSVLSALAIRTLVRGESRPGWPRKHVRFGVRGFLSGLFSDLNTRIDVLVLGVFALDPVVGAYSLAAIMAEGAYQILIALRTNYAPIVVRLLAAKQHDELRAVIARARRKTYAGALALGVLAIAGYALVIPLITSDPLLQDSWQYFAIVIAGMVASAGYAPFVPVLLWAGKPGWHTILIGTILGAGTLANIVLTATLEAHGAAIATAATYAWSVIALKWLTKRALDLKI
jgi:O-antigen/teichoic acid export membrane protein